MSEVENEGGLVLSMDAGPMRGRWVASLFVTAVGGWQLYSHSSRGLVGGKMRAAKSTEPRVETNVGCKLTFLKAAWAS